MELRAESERLTIRNAELSASLSQITQANAALDRADREKSTALAMAKKQLTEVQAVRAQQGGLLTQLREAEKSWQAERRILTRQLRAEAAYGAASVASAVPLRSGGGKVGSRGGSKGAAAAEVEDALAKARLSVVAGGE